MRIATPADYDAIEKIAYSELLLAYPVFIPPAPGRVGGFAEQLTWPGTIVCCADDVSAFILSRRWDVTTVVNGVPVFWPMAWQVIWLMPHTLDDVTSTAMLAFAFKQEHAVRPFKPTVTCFARLLKASAIEARTAAGFTRILNATNVDDGREITISRTADQLALSLGVSLV